MAAPIHPIGGDRFHYLGGTHNVIFIVVPEPSIGGYSVELRIMAVDFLFLRRVVKILEYDLFLLNYSNMEVVYYQDNQFIGRLALWSVYRWSFKS